LAYKQFVGCEIHSVDSIVLTFEEALQRRENLTQQEKVVLSVEALEHEVKNGGFGQFFCNSSREFVPDIGGALVEIEDAARDASEVQDEKLGE
jgi:hypothetical protein